MRWILAVLVVAALGIAAECFVLALLLLNLIGLTDASSSLEALSRQFVVGQIVTLVTAVILVTVIILIVEIALKKALRTGGKYVKG